jgi:uncharacterized membrane protein
VSWSSDFFLGPAKYFSVWQDFHVCQSEWLTTSQQVSGSLLYTTSGLWFVVYSVVYTLYQNSPVVGCLYTTSGLWFVVYSVHKFVQYKECPVNYDIMYIQQSIPQITIHWLYIDTLQQVNWIVICGVFCCIYIIPQSTCCKVTIYNKWIVICGILCCIYNISQFTCCKVTEDCKLLFYTCSINQEFFII